MRRCGREASRSLAVSLSRECCLRLRGAVGTLHSRPECGLRALAGAHRHVLQAVQDRLHPSWLVDAEGRSSTCSEESWVEYRGIESRKQTLSPTTSAPITEQLGTRVSELISLKFGTSGVVPLVNEAHSCSRAASRLTALTMLTALALQSGAPQ